MWQFASIIFVSNGLILHIDSEELCSLLQESDLRGLPSGTSDEAGSIFDGSGIIIGGVVNQVVSDGGRDSAVLLVVSDPSTVCHITLVSVVVGTSGSAD